MGGKNPQKSAKKGKKSWGGQPPRGCDPPSPKLRSTGGRGERRARSDVPYQHRGIPLYSVSLGVIGHNSALVGEESKFQVPKSKFQGRSRTRTAAVSASFSLFLSFPPPPLRRP